MGAALGPILGIGTSLFGGWMGSRQSGMQKEAWGAMKDSMKNLTGAGQAAMGYAKDQYNLASPAYGQSLSYYSRLLGGNRGQMALATAGPRAAIQDLYRGATNNVDRGMARGGERDLQKATLNRDRASKLAGLVTGVQPMAASQLGALAGAGLDRANNFTSTGVSAFGTGANAAAAAYKGATEQADRAGKAWAQAGQNIYNMLPPKWKEWQFGRTPKPGFEANDKYWNNPDYKDYIPGTPVQNPDMNPDAWQPYPGAVVGGPGFEAPYYGSPQNPYGPGGSSGGTPYVPGTGGYGSAPPGYDPNDPYNW